MDNTEKPVSAISIDTGMVKHMALLIRLKITEEEAGLFSQQFSKIIEYFHILNEIDTTLELTPDEDPSLVNIFREDRVFPSMSREEFLANAPGFEGPYVKVPRVFDDR
jgi:aspartyl-tRNA(Asn)/glutamyl-tRNA(Gln) amidotransferase subunit C